MSLLTINGTGIKTPSTYNVTVYDLDSESSVRDASGNMHRDRVCVKRKVEISYNVVLDTEIKALLDCLNSASFTLAYKDLTGETRTGNFYVGDRSGTLYSNTEKHRIWKDLKFNFIEM